MLLLVNEQFYARQVHPKANLYASMLHTEREHRARSVALLGSPGLRACCFFFLHLLLKSSSTRKMDEPKAKATHHVSYRICVHILIFLCAPQQSFNVSRIRINQRSTFGTSTAVDMRKHGRANDGSRGPTVLPLLFITHTSLFRRPAPVTVPGLGHVPFYS